MNRAAESETAESERKCACVTHAVNVPWFRHPGEWSISRTMRDLLVLLAVVTLVAGCGGSKKNSDDPPVPGQNLTVTTSGATSISLSWAPATDDETPTAALEYLAFFSTANNLNGVEAVEANGTPVGAYAAAVTDVDVTGLTPDLAYYFSVLVRDEADHRAAYTAVPALTIETCGATLPAGGCPDSSPGNFSICGRIADAQTDAFFEAAGATGAACPGTPTTDGPCSVGIRFYDALDFAGNPSGAVPIVPGSLVVDDCGRFRATEVAPGGLSFVAVVTDDAIGTTDRHRRSSANVAASTSKLRTYVVRNETDTAWSTSAGLVGPTFVDRGVVAMDFRYQGAGRAGVTVTRNGSTQIADDYYFSDGGPMRTTVDPGLLVTGTNGTGLILNSTLQNHSGQGGEPTGCEWQLGVAVATSGVVLWFASEAVVTGSSTALCP